MSKVQGLNKQFTEKDVTRMRNLIQGKHGEKTGQNVGYAKKTIHYKEGDVWEQDGTYVKKINNADIDGVIEEFKLFIESELTLNNNSFITEQGDVEKWNGRPNVEKVLEGLSKTIEHLQNMKSK